MIGVDVDGVLADQITGVLERIERDWGIHLGVEDVNDWRLPVGSSDIGSEIERALVEEEYVLQMPVHDGAEAMIDSLRQDHELIILTARGPDVVSRTGQWLRNNRLWVDRIVATGEGAKGALRTDVLIDDYLGNVVEFLETTPRGIAVLVDRPWNRNRKELEPWIASGRAFVVEELGAIPDLVKKLTTRQDKSAGAGPGSEDRMKKARKPHPRSRTSCRSH